MLYLVRHGEAVPEENDPARPLQQIESFNCEEYNRPQEGSI